MRILHFVLILAVAILLKKNVYCDSSNPLLPKPKASPFQFLATNTQLDQARRRRPPPPPRAPPPPPPPPPSLVKAYQLVVQWPPGVCTGNSGVKCQINPVPPEFKIHGLWPDPNGLPIETFAWKEIANLSSDLNTYWPNLKSKQQQVGENSKFWEHEWIDHGKYSEMGVHEYFNKTLELFKDVGKGLKVKLAAENITATNIDKDYKLQAIEDALKKINDNFVGICE